MPDKQIFDDATVNQVRANIFPPAHAAIPDWHNFPWHTGPKGNCDSGQANSSQALAVDVFGTLKMSDQRDAIFNRVAEQIGLPAGSGWQIELEYLDGLNLLREKRLTQVDAAAFCSSALIFFECKFTESDGGRCRQILPSGSGKHQGILQCNGTYGRQTNHVNSVEARCELSGKGIRYWEVIPEVFYLQEDQDYDPCPFRYSSYQWMRNLTNCYALAEHLQRRAGFVVVYADVPFLPMAQKIHSQDWAELKRKVRTDQIAFGELSYQELICTAAEADPEHGLLWCELQAWVERKIHAAPRVPGV